MQAVNEHKMVLESPTPVVFFTEFGDHALNFSVSFWVRVRHIMELKKVPSDIRFRIDELFGEHKNCHCFSSTGCAF